MSQGVVIIAGGTHYLPQSLKLVQRLRGFTSRLPIEVWQLASESVTDSERAAFLRLGDVEMIRCDDPAIKLGWALKPLAVQKSKFDQVMLLDADTALARDPADMFGVLANRDSAIFWPDTVAIKATAPAWELLGLDGRRQIAVESGQVMIDKNRCGNALDICVGMNRDSDRWYKEVYGDKDTFPLAWIKAGTPFTLVRSAMTFGAGVFWQHDFRGQPLFGHDTRTGSKSLADAFPQTYETLAGAEAMTAVTPSTFARLGGK